jgi:hypothetical protein
MRSSARSPHRMRTGAPPLRARRSRPRRSPSPSPVPGQDPESSRHRRRSRSSSPARAAPPPRHACAARATLALRPRQRLAVVMRRGLVLNARCSERCWLDLVLLLPRRTARALGFRASKPVELGYVSRQLHPGVRRRITIRLNQVARRRLRGLGFVRVVLRIRTVDDARNSRLTNRHLTLRR